MIYRFSIFEGKKLDALLDKINDVGYENLTPEEKELLKRASSGEDIEEKGTVVLDDNGRLMVGEETVDDYQKGKSTKKAKEAGYEPTESSSGTLIVRVYWKKGDKRRAFYMYQNTGGKPVITRYKTNTGKMYGSFYRSDDVVNDINDLWAELDKTTDGHEVLKETDARIFSQFVEEYDKWKEMYRQDKEYRSKRLGRLYNYIKDISDTMGPQPKPPAPKMPTPKSGGTPKKKRTRPVLTFPDGKKKGLISKFLSSKYKPNELYYYVGTCKFYGNIKQQSGPGILLNVGDTVVLMVPKDHFDKTGNLLNEEGVFPISVMVRCGIKKPEEGQPNGVFVTNKGLTPPTVRKTLTQAGFLRDEKFDVFCKKLKIFG